MRDKPERPRQAIHRLDEIPVFRTEDDERTFWETHEVSDELADQAEPLPEDVVALLDRIRENRARRKATIG